MEKAKILIVEDEAIIAMEIESQLQGLGYEVISIVDTGEKAIKKAGEDNPDLILMDIRIKGEMDGIQTAAIIREQFDIPVVFSTAYLDEERIELAKLTMPFGYVLKPVQERDLKVTIEMALYVSKVDGERTKAEKRFKTIFEEAPLGVALIDSLTGYIFEVNQKYADIAGRTREEIEIIDWMSITHPDDIQKDLDNMSLLNAGNINGFNMEKRYVRPDDSEVWVNLTVTSIFVEDKAKPLHLAMIEDITERKQTEQELSKVNEDLHIHQVELEQQNDELRKSQLQITELQNKYFDLYEMAPVGYLTFNEKGLITEANLTSCTMLGIEKSVFKGLGFSNFTDEESQDDFYLHRRQVIETKTQQTCELTLVRKDKSKFLARLESKAVFDDKGEFIQLNTNIIDIGKPK
ncbi:MAG: PAS domain S-box protein [Deltaproteobacteria bacterium]|nr:PAS domain S-box protein [Deltaproteobacteria bacterium]MBT4643005.1 PAS domain S-box protein [Deltaproteobacteria bacterium]